jgi:hypothetical protein
LLSGRNNPLKISKRDKKILTVGTLAVVLIFVVNYVIVPFIESEMDIRERTQQKEMVLQKYEKIMNQRDEVEKELDQLRGKQNKLRKKLLKGSTPSLAAAEMQKVLEKSVKVKDEEEKGEFLAIPLEVRLITDLNRTRKFLADLEKNAKCLVIPKLKISVKNQRDPKEVIVTLVVTGFFIKKGVEKKEV